MAKLINGGNKVENTSWHWDIRLKEYIDSEWSNGPTPFAQKVAEYIKPQSKILELGAGAGQDSIWFAKNGHKVTCSDQTSVVFDQIQKRANDAGVELILKVVDLTKLQDIPTDSFDVVYAQLVIHYFDDVTTSKIYDELYRIVKNNGIIAVMVNTVHDDEYKPELLDKNGFIHHKGLTKRYFSKESLSPFVEKFHPLLFDEMGRTPKDDAKQNRGMVRFIGKK